MYKQLELLNPANKHKKMSRHYVDIDSRKLAKDILCMGDGKMFQLADVKLSRKTQEGLVKGPHLMRFRTTRPAKFRGDEIFPELVVKNSYCGESKLEVWLGLFRVACANGLVVKTHDFGEIAIRHMGTSHQIAKEAVEGMVYNLQKTLPIINKWSQIHLSAQSTVEYATRAAGIRWADKELTSEDIQTLLQPQRDQDGQNDLWTIFNVVQERLLNGNESGETILGRKQKALSNVNKIVDVNTKLFALTEEFAMS